MIAKRSHTTSWTPQHNIFEVGNLHYMDNMGFDSWQRQETFLFSEMSRPVLGPSQPPVSWALGVKWPWCDAVHSHEHEITSLWSHPPSFLHFNLALSGAEFTITVHCGTAIHLASLIIELHHIVTTKVSYLLDKWHKILISNVRKREVLWCRLQDMTTKWWEHQMCQGLEQTKIRFYVWNHLQKQKHTLLRSQTHTHSI